MTPFLKWVGGKRWLVDSKQLEVPRSYRRYIEPFLGGGAVFFRIRPRAALLSDLNSRLIECYEVVRDDPEQIKLLLEAHASGHSKDYYYEVRAKAFGTKLERAGQFLYLNRTCFNGIYRENLRGEFNVPKGSKDTVLFDNDDFLAWSNALQGVSLETKDFEVAIDEANEGDFVFADPPYTVRHNRNGFIKYNQKMFSWEDQQRLARALKSAAERGVNFVLTNADHPVVRELYEGFEEKRSVARTSLVAANATNRSKTTELLVSSRSANSDTEWETAN